jgi:hypothetical protein
MADGAAKTAFYGIAALRASSADVAVASDPTGTLV